MGIKVPFVAITDLAPDYLGTMIESLSPIFAIFRLNEGGYFEGLCQGEGVILTESTFKVYYKKNGMYPEGMFWSTGMVRLFPTLTELEQYMVNSWNGPMFVPQTKLVSSGEGLAHTAMQALKIGGDPAGAFVVEVTKGNGVSINWAVWGQHYHYGTVEQNFEGRHAPFNVIG